MLRGVFVTGTDTDVGKTVVAAALIHRLRNQVPVCYWKPIQTGIEQADDTTTVAALGACAAEEIFDRGERLRLPLSPHLSARAAGRTIVVADLVRLVFSANSGQFWVVEGAGGALVPINDVEQMTDLMERLGLAAIVTARSGLGTINHTLLTLEALRRRRVELAGVVMVGDPNSENRDAIERFGAATVLGQMPRFPALDSQILGAWARSQLDPDGALRRFF
jgi:dethiobiotin synthase